jgi:aminobenzoyl-glutamate transport protein
MALAVVVVSGIAARLELSAIHPGNGEVIEVVSLLSIPGLHRILTEMVDNFTGFAPLGTVFVAMLGIGTVIATMLPYTVAFLVVWMVLLSVWLLLGIPVGPGVPIEISVS